MPRKYSRRHPRKSRRRSRRYRGRKNKTTTVVHSRGPIAPRTITKLKYTQGFSNPGVALDYSFNLNSIHDPDLTGSGHQPYGHDTYSTIYNRYRVFACSYSIRATSIDTTSTNTWLITIGANNSPTAYTNVTLAAESPNFRTFYVQGSSRMQVIRGRYNLPRLTGSTSVQYKSDDRYQAQFGASPTEQLVLHVLTSNLDGSSYPASGTVGFTITMIFHVELFDPKELAQS